MAKDEEAAVLNFGEREVRVTHPSKPYFTRETRVSKIELVKYYVAIADGALAGIRDRPIVLKRFVNGADGPPFYQKRAPEKRPSWLRTVTLSFPSGRTAEEIVVDDAAGLAWIVNLGNISMPRGRCVPRLGARTRDGSASFISPVRAIAPDWQKR